MTDNIISAIGPYDFKMMATLDAEILSYYNLTLDQLDDTASLKLLLNDVKLIENLELCPMNSLATYCFFFNKGNPVKLPITLLSICSTKFIDSFFKSLFESVLKKANILLSEPNNIGAFNNVSVEFTFEDRTKTVSLVDMEEEKPLNLLAAAPLLGKCKFLFVDFNSILSLVKSNDQLSELIAFIETAASSKANIFVNFPDFVKNAELVNVEFIELVNYIFSLCDMLIFEKKEAIAFFNLNKQIQTEDDYDVEIDKKKANLLFMTGIKKKNSKLNKIGVFIDELKEVDVIEQTAKTDIILSHVTDEFGIYTFGTDDANLKRKKTVLVNYQKLKSIFIAVFINRLIIDRNYHKAVEVGVTMTKRIYELVRYGEKLPLVDQFYKIKGKRQRKTKTKPKDIVDTKERGFLLDCVNEQKSKLKDYNPLYDGALVGFFSKKSNLTTLVKQGLVTKRGKIINNFEKRSKLTNPLFKEVVAEKNKLHELKETTYKMQLEINSFYSNLKKHSLVSTTTDKLKNFTRIANFHPLKIDALPSITNVPTGTSLYTKEKWMKQKKVSKKEYDNVLQDYEKRAKTNNFNE